MLAIRRICLLVLASLGCVGCATALAPAPSIVLPFDPHANQVTISATANGTPLRFLVDTAVDPSAIDRPMAMVLGLRPTGNEGAIEGVGSDIATAFPSVLPELVIGGRRYAHIEVLVNDMSKIRARFGVPLDGILGYSLLKDHAVLIDYPSNRIEIFNGPASHEPRQCRQVDSFPLRFQSEEEKLILVPGLAINGVEVPAMLDTGSSNGLRIEVDAPALAGVKSILPKGAEGTSVGARGQAAVRYGLLTAPVTLGPFKLNQTDVALAGVRNPDVPVNIGNRFLRAIGAKLLVDIPSNKITLYGECAS